MRVHRGHGRTEREHKWVSPPCQRVPPSCCRGGSVVPLFSIRLDRPLASGEFRTRIVLWSVTRITSRTRTLTAVGDLFLPDRYCPRAGACFIPRVCERMRLWSGSSYLFTCRTKKRRDKLLIGLWRNLIDLPAINRRVIYRRVEAFENYSPGKIISFVYSAASRMPQWQNCVGLLALIAQISPFLRIYRSFFSRSSLVEARAFNSGSRSNDYPLSASERSRRINYRRTHACTRTRRCVSPLCGYL